MTRRPDGSHVKSCAGRLGLSEKQHAHRLGGGGLTDLGQVREKGREKRLLE